MRQVRQRYMHSDLKVKREGREEGKGKAGKERNTRVRLRGLCTLATR